MRYKLTQSFADGDYILKVGGDDGYRLSLDGELPGQSTTGMIMVIRQAPTTFTLMVLTIL